MKKTMNGTTVNPASLAEALGGRKTKKLSVAFPAVWTPEGEGEFILGQYTGTESVHPKGSDKPFDSFNIGLDAWKATFARSGNPYTPIRGEIIGVSGDLLARALKELKPGTVVAIEYKGLGRKVGKRSPAKLFDVQEVEA